jgi:hypothetical protein
MDAPSPRDLPAAYVPGWTDPDTADDEEGETRDRATIIRDARAERLEEGLPVDDATLERVADAVASPDYPLPGLHLTFEEAADDVPEDVERAVDAFLDARPEMDGGQRLGWRDGERTLFVGLVGTDEEIADAVRRLPRRRVVVERRRTPRQALIDLADRIADDHDALSKAGFELAWTGPDTTDDRVEIAVTGGKDAATAERFLTERYGAGLHVVWLGPSTHKEVARPFGSYRSTGTTLRIYYALDPNGELEGNARLVTETREAVVVETTVLEPVGVRTLIGGFLARHVDLDLRGPLGDRRVVDHASGEPRPSVDDLVGR